MVSALKNKKYGDFIRTFFHKSLENVFHRELTAATKMPTTISDHSVLDIECLADSTRFITEHMTNEEKILLGLYLAQYSSQEISKLLNMPHDTVEKKIQKIKFLLSKPNKI